MALNPQQILFKEAYLNPDSPTFSNAYRSALQAGYEDEYAKNITSKGNDWMAEIVRDKERVTKAESRLDEILNLDLEDPNKLRAVSDISKFVTSRLAKDKYSDRQEHTGPGGKELTINVVNYGDKDEDSI